MADQADNIDSEIWKDVVGWEGLYQVSSHGRLYRYPRLVNSKDNSLAFKAGRIIVGSVNKGIGYRETEISRDGKKTKAYYHVLTCEAFHGPKPTPKHQVAHGDGDRANNHKDNLRWATPKENAADRKLHNTEYEGEAHWKTELTEADVRSIRERYKPGYGGYTELAREYGLTRGAIFRIVKRRNWKHVE